VSLTTKVLIALAAGLGLGILVSLSGSADLARLPSVIEPVGTLWVNAVRMTVIPLVVGCIIGAVTSAPDARTIGRIGGRALLLFVVMLFGAAVFAAMVAPPLLVLIPLEPTAVEALRAAGAAAAEGASESVKRIPTFGQWLVELVPTNPIKAAADGAMLPLILFSVVFGLAITRLSAEGRGVLQGFFRAIADASLTLVQWVLAAAPIGVFALAVPLAARLGVAAAGALVGYIAIIAVICTVFGLLVIYPVTAIVGRVSIARFARGALPAQAVAISARSSLASLPAMMEGARTRLGLPDQVTSFFLPLAASTFRVGGALGLTTGVLFIAKLYGVELSLVDVGNVIVTVVLTTFSVPGIPAGSIIVMVPTLMAAGLPVAGMGILLGADTIPDMFRTATNVTGDMAAAVMLSRGEQSPPPAGPTRGPDSSDAAGA
jgi:Na+/H+-dicarboxylate symporter